MPIQEENVPWAATRAAEREPYPRKNLYFVGEGADEVYDYCVWHANVEGHLRLEGKPARGSSAYINDLLLRTYLQAMLEPGAAERFSAWRTATYEVDGRSVRPAEPRPELLLLSKNVHRLSEPTIFVPSLNRRVSEDEAKTLMREFVSEARRRHRR